MMELEKLWPREEREGKRSLFLLNEQQIHHYWGDLEKELSRTRMYDHWRPEQILEQLINGAMQCWALSNGEIQLILISDILVYSNGSRSLRFVGCVGRELDAYLPLIRSSFAKVTKRLECGRVEVVGREGWARKLKGLGFKHLYTVVYFDLEPLPREH